MYELDPTKLAVARANVSTDPAVQDWTRADKDGLVIQAIALMEDALVPLPPGAMDEFASVRIPQPQFSGIDTEFHPWSDQDVQAASARGATANLGEVRLGDNVQTRRILQDFPALNTNQVRLLQLRVLVHEFFHALDFRDVLRGVHGDRDRAIALQAQEIGFFGNRAGYARNEIETDLRAAIVLERNGLLFSELGQSLVDYRSYWQGRRPLTEQAFAAVLVLLNRTRYP